MAFNKHVFLTLATTVYTVAFIATFDELRHSVMISSMALVGLCGWFYGLRTGLLSIIPCLLLNTAILFFVSGQPCDILQTYNPLGIILCIITACAAGSLKESYEELSAAQSSLALHVDEATSELDNLARQLIENDEQERIQIGQDLHDGVGQYLTSMLLHCEALSLKLREAKRVEADLAEWMTRRIHTNIQTVRQLSRSLLPIQFTETTLETALDEMAAYFNDVSTANIRLKGRGNSSDIPISTAQHLYRVMHEATFRAIYEQKARKVDIKLVTGRHHCRIRVKGSEISRQSPFSSGSISEVMKYRIRAIGGKLAFTELAKGRFRLECSANFKTEAESWSGTV
ncbi:MAG: hypothetical protein DRP64_09770 [Verrucomicrobia bacterium]|nr:MAG: hypothetical protein DRP64_09770 [Verrucomicrobiota bacterium]